MLREISEIAAFYLYNILERPYSRFPYGFEGVSDIQVTMNCSRMYGKKYRKVSADISTKPLQKKIKLCLDEALIRQLKIEMVISDSSVE